MLHKLWPYIAVALFSSLVFFGPSNAQSVATEDATATQAVIRDQLTAFQQREHERAFSHAAPNIRKMFRETDRFIGMVKNGYPAIYNSKSFSFARNRMAENLVHQEVLITDPQGKEWQAYYTLQKQDDGNWKIMGVQMFPSKGTST